MQAFGPSSGSCSPQNLHVFGQKRASSLFQFAVPSCFKANSVQHATPSYTGHGHVAFPGKVISSFAATVCVEHASSSAATTSRILRRGRPLIGRARRLDCGCTRDKRALAFYYYYGNEPNAWHRAPALFFWSESHSGGQLATPCEWVDVVRDGFFSHHAVHAPRDAHLSRVRRPASRMQPRPTHRPLRRAVGYALRAVPVVHRTGVSVL
jgi:hypothetical protein